MSQNDQCAFPKSIPRVEEQGNVTCPSMNSAAAISFITLKSAIQDWSLVIRERSR